MRLMIIPLMLMANFATALDLEEATVDLSNIDNIQLKLEKTVSSWRPVIERAARQLLMALVGLALAWQAIQMVLKTPDIQEFFTEVARITLFAGFFLMIIQYSADWAATIVESFTQLAAQANASNRELADQSAPTLRAADTLRIGLKIAINMITERASWYELIPMSLLAATIVLIHAGIAGYQLVVLAEMYVITAAGVILLGFGGSGWTIEYAKRYIQYCLSVGGKLFALYLLIGLAEQVYLPLQVLLNWNITDAIAALGLVALVSMLIFNVPGMLQEVMNGAFIRSAAPSVASMAKTAATTMQAMKALISKAPSDSGGNNISHTLNKAQSTGGFAAYKSGQEGALGSMTKAMAKSEFGRQYHGQDSPLKALPSLRQQSGVSATPSVHKETKAGQGNEHAP